MAEKSIYFYKEGETPKGDPTRFGFPGITADLDTDLMKELEMEPALKRFADKLFKLFKDDELIGIKITGIDFVRVFKSEEEKTTW